MWFIQPQNDLAVAMIPKAGVNSIRKWLREYEVVTNDDPQLLKMGRRVAFIRNPLARLRSAFSYFRGLDNQNIKHSVKAPTGTWASFVDFILENDDPHWHPQSDIAGDKQNIIHHFEDFNLYAPYYCNNIIYHLNKSVPRPVYDYRLHDIMNLYSRDYDLWDNCYLTF